MTESRMVMTSRKRLCFKEEQPILKALLIGSLDLMRLNFEPSCCGMRLSSVSVKRCELLGSIMEAPERSLSRYSLIRMRSSSVR